MAVRAMGEQAVCRRCGREFDLELSDAPGDCPCSYHPSPPVKMGTTGPRRDYAEVWRFPCCGETVIGEVGADGRDIGPSQSPGCRTGPHAAGPAQRAW
jgi:hypothetical protein